MTSKSGTYQKALSQAIKALPEPKAKELYLYMMFMQSKTTREMPDPSQAWFWSETWQKGERQADDDIRHGRMSGPFKTAKEALKHLHAK